MWNKDLFVYLFKGAPEAYEQPSLHAAGVDPQARGTRGPVPRGAQYDPHEPRNASTRPMSGDRRGGPELRTTSSGTSELAAGKSIKYDRRGEGGGGERAGVVGPRWMWKTTYTCNFLPLILSLFEICNINFLLFLYLKTLYMFIC